MHLIVRLSACTGNKWCDRGGAKVDLVVLLTEYLALSDTQQLRPCSAALLSSGLFVQLNILPVGQVRLLQCVTECLRHAGEHAAAACEPADVENLLLQVSVLHVSSCSLVSVYVLRMELACSGGRRARR